MDSIHTIPAAGFIKLHGIFIFNSYHKITLQATLGLQTTLDLIHEQAANTMFTKNRIHSQVIDETAPPIKSPNDRTDHFPIGFGHQEQVGVTLEFLLDFFRLIGTADMDSGAGIFPEGTGSRVIFGEMKFT